MALETGTTQIFVVETTVSRARLQAALSLALPEGSFEVWRDDDHPLCVECKSFSPHHTASCSRSVEMAL
jgi:hypothetical protein